jgi:hypothetical protein
VAEIVGFALSVYSKHYLLAYPFSPIGITRGLKKGCMKTCSSLIRFVGSAVSNFLTKSIAESDRVIDLGNVKSALMIVSWCLLLLE